MIFVFNGMRNAAQLSIALLLPAFALSLVLGPRPALQAADFMTCGSADIQFLGFSDALNKTSFGGLPVTELSGITFDRQRGVYYAVPDRSSTAPAQIFTLTVPLDADSLGVPFVSSAAKVSGPDGAWFTGANLDAEGIALASSTDAFIASEGGSGAGEQPEIVHVSIHGGYLGALPVPPVFQIGVNNLSFESIAISPSGRSLFVAVEGPLPPDGRTADLQSRIRILRYENRGIEGFLPAEQYFYLTDSGRTASDLGVSELIALSDSDLLVLERGFVEGEGNTVRLYTVSLQRAPDVSGVPSLAATSVRPLAKALVLDLEACPSAGARLAPGATQSNALLDNFEGMTLGPDLPGGRRSLLLISDDNAGGNQTTRIIGLSVSAEKLSNRP